MQWSEKTAIKLKNDPRNGLHTIIPSSLNNHQMNTAKIIVRIRSINTQGLICHLELGDLAEGACEELAFWRLRSRSCGIWGINLNQNFLTNGSRKKAAKKQAERIWNQKMLDRWKKLQKISEQLVPEWVGHL